MSVLTPDKVAIDGNIATFWLSDRKPECEPYYVRTIRKRYYVQDARVNAWDAEDWKPEWPKYSNYHEYWSGEMHKYRDRILHIGPTGDIRTKHFLLRKNLAPNSQVIY